MSVLIPAGRPWAGQPGPSSRARGPRILLNPGAGPGKDVATGRVWAPRGNVALRGDKRGNVYDFDGVSSSYEYTGYPELSGSIGTMFAWCPVVGTADPDNGSTGCILLSSAGVWFQINAAGACAVHGSGFNSSGSDISWYSSTNRSIVMASDGTSGGLRVFVDGVDSGQRWTSAPGAWEAGSRAMRIGGYAGGTLHDFNGRMLVLGYIDRYWTQADAKRFHADPFSVYEPRRIWVPVASSGTTYDVSVDEAASASDAASSVVQLAAALSEAASAAEAASSIAEFVAAMTEVASASDAAAGVLILPAAVSEAASAADALAAAMELPAESSEAASAVDAVSASGTLAAALAEAATGADAQTAGIAADAAITEAATAAETATSTLTLTAAVSEAGTATDAISVIATLSAVLAEAGDATDAAIAVMTMAASLAEAASAADTVTWGSVAYDVDLAEAATATDSLSAAAVLTAVLAEGGTAADAIAAVQLLGATVTELGSAGDAATGVLVMGVSIAEAGTASDVWIASIPSAGPAPTSRTWLIASESRIWLIPAESRT